MKELDIFINTYGLFYSRCDIFTAKIFDVYCPIYCKNNKNEMEKSAYLTLTSKYSNFNKNNCTNIRHYEEDYNLFFNHNGVFNIYYPISRSFFVTGF